MDKSKMRFHKGIDIAAREGRMAQNFPLYAVADGVIHNVNTSLSSAGGNQVTVKHTTTEGRVFYILYAHMSKILVKIGDSVRPGTVIGNAGNTGSRSTGYHLHLQLSDDKGNTYDPTFIYQYIPPVPMRPARTITTQDSLTHYVL